MEDESKVKLNDEESAESAEDSLENAVLVEDEIKEIEAENDEENEEDDEDEEDDEAVVKEVEEADSLSSITSINLSTQLGAYSGTWRKANLEEELAGQDFSSSKVDSLYDEDNESSGRDFYSEASSDSIGSDIYMESGGVNDLYKESGRDGLYQTGADQGESKLYSVTRERKKNDEGLRHGNESQLEIKGLQSGFGVIDEDTGKNSKRDRRDNKYN